MGTTELSSNLMRTDRKNFTRNFLLVVNHNVQTHNLSSASQSVFCLNFTAAQHTISHVFDRPETFMILTRCAHGGLCCSLMMTTSHVHSKCQGRPLLLGKPRRVEVASWTGLQVMV